MLEDAARRWIGLTLGHCEHSEPFTLHDLTLDDPALVLWLSDAPQLRIRRGDSRWTLHPKAGLFDYYPAGHYAQVERAAGPASALKISILGEWRQTLGLDDDAWAQDRQPHFQFRDKRLERLVRLVRQLDAHHGPAQPRPHALAAPLYVDYLKHATLACWAEHQAADRWHRNASALPEPTRRVITDYVDSVLTQGIGIDELAALAGYSEAQFMRRFKATFDMPPHRYILARRVDRAKQLMQSSDMTLTAIAQQLGFASHAHFTTAFKLRTGTTPSAFRRQPAPQGADRGAPCECR